MPKPKEYNNIELVNNITYSRPVLDGFQPKPQLLLMQN